ncbi:MAG: rhomboid family intramembrane serine protease [Bacteroidota bacterium]
MRVGPYSIDEPQNYSHRSNFSLLKNNFIALYTFITFTCLITFWVWADRDNARQIRYIYHYDSVVLGDLYRLFTSGFLHLDKTHLRNNMTTLFVYGLFLCYRTKMSNIKFCLLYVSAIIFSNYFAHRYYMYHLDDPNIRILGASGAVFAVRFASLLLIPSPRNIKKINLMRILHVCLLCYLFFNTYNKLNMLQRDDIAHEAHFGGALYGSAFALFCYPKLVFLGILADKPATPKD